MPAAASRCSPNWAGCQGAPTTPGPLFLRFVNAVKGPWAAVVVDRIEPHVAKYEDAWPVWGYRKIVTIAATEGWDVGSALSVKRVMSHQGHMQQVRYQAEHR